MDHNVGSKQNAFCAILRKRNVFLFVNQLALRQELIYMCIYIYSELTIL